MFTNNKLTSILISAALAVQASACAYAAENTTVAMPEVKIIYDGEELNFDTAAQNIDGTILVPMRAVLEAFGASVKWDSENQTVNARKKSGTYTMKLGEKEISKSKNDSVVSTATAEQAMQLIDGRSMIPLRALGEILSLDVEWDDETKTVTLSSSGDETDDTWKDNTGTIDLDNMAVEGDGVAVDGNIVTVTKGGDFTVTGNCADGRIIIDTEDRVKLRLKSMSLASSEGAPVYAKNTDKLFITSEDGTENTITDNSTYSETAETNACIYSKGDIEFKGEGILNINAKSHHGISAKDSLKIESGVINIVSEADGIHVNDTGEITGGVLNITAGYDGIDSESILDVTGGEINITCTGDVSGRGGFFDTEDETALPSSKGMKASWYMNIDGADISIKSNDTCIKSDSELDIKSGNLSLCSDKAKGIKGMEDIYITGGNIDIEKSTEGIETKRILKIDGGEIDITASDDGINAGGDGSLQGGGMKGGGTTGADMPDRDMQDKDMKAGRNMQNDVLDGDVSDMGNESERMMPQGKGGGMRGERPENSIDMDGENIPRLPDGVIPPPINEKNTDAERADRPSRENMAGMGRNESTEISTEHHIEINGGSIYINADGDGIDSNGSLVINGGTVIVEGTERGGNSALDHDGLFTINGGTVLGMSNGSMIENASETSAQNTISAYVTAQSGDSISVVNSDGDSIYSYKIKKNIGHIMFSSEKLVTGEEYTIKANDESALTVQISKKINIVR